MKSKLKAILMGACGLAVIYGMWVFNLAFSIAAYFGFRCPAEGCPSCPVCKITGKS